MYSTFIDWFYQLLTGFASAFNWLTTPIDITSELSVSPLGMISFGGLVAFITIAIVKWIAS